MSWGKACFALAALAASIALLGGSLLLGPTRLQAADDQPPAITAAGTPASYANFCRVTGTAEEVILDFGLNTHPIGRQASPIEVSNRVVMNYFTAKRMVAALQISIQRHEAVFGKIETNVKKRVKRQSP